MTDDSEKRFHSIMDKLFHTPKSASRFFLFLAFFPFGSRENKGKDLIEYVFSFFLFFNCAKILRLTFVSAKTDVLLG